MKRSEIKPFKCFIPARIQYGLVVEELKRIGWSDAGSSLEQVAAIYFRPSRKVPDTYSMPAFLLTDFAYSELPEMTFDQVMEMLKSVEPEERGMWVVRDISKDGGYSFNGEAYNWQELPRDKRAIFGGWMFPNHEGWQVIRRGDTPGAAMENHATNWVKPLIPMKIRFWVP